MTEENLPETSGETTVIAEPIQVEGTVMLGDCQHDLSELTGALAKIQAGIKNPTTNRDIAFNAKTKFKYIDLPKLLDYVRPILAKEGISLTQRIVQVGERMFVNTRIYKGNSYLEDIFPIFYDMPKMGAGSVSLMQSFQSAVTYAKRCSIANLLGIAAESDESEQVLTDSARPAPTPQVKTPPTPETADTNIPVTEEQLTELRKIIGSSGRTVQTVEQWCRDKVEGCSGTFTLKDLNQTQYARVFLALTKEKEES